MACKSVAIVRRFAATGRAARTRSSAANHPSSSLASIGGLPLLFAWPVFKTVPTPRSIAKDAIAERAPGPADKAEVKERDTSSLYPAAASGAGFVIRRLSRRWLGATLEPECWRYQPRLGQVRPAAILTNNLGGIAPGCPLVRCTFPLLSNFSHFSNSRGTSTNFDHIPNRGPAICSKLSVRFG